jgi:hypothetical protein
VNRKYLRAVVFVTLIGLAVGTVSPPVSAVGLNQSCKKAGVTATTKSKGKTVRVKCMRAGKKLRWVQVHSAIKTPVITSVPKLAIAPVTTSAPMTTIAPVTSSATIATSVPALIGTVSQRNAVSKAASYLRSSAFSRAGLISQLEYEKFSFEDATYGVDAQKADWNAQAVKKAASYLKSSAFSLTGLIEQLEYEKFTNAESVFGVNAQNADWNAQAAKKAASYLKSSSFSRSGLIDQLLYEGFTQEQSEYGVSTTGL